MNEQKEQVEVFPDQWDRRAVAEQDALPRRQDEPIESIADGRQGFGDAAILPAFALRATSGWPGGWQKGCTT